MPDIRKHRGAHPEDQKLFAEDQISQLRAAWNPDKEIIASDRIAISSDGPLLDQTRNWINLGRYIIEQRCDHFWLIDLHS